MQVHHDMHRSRARHLLLTLRNQLVSDYHDALEAADAEMDAHEVQDHDEAIAHWTRCVEERFTAARERELTSVIAALKRLDDSSYGVCVTCLAMIDNRRLRDHPAVEQCAVCDLRPAAQILQRRRPDAPRAGR